MNTKILIVLLVLSVIAAGGYYYMQQGASEAPDQVEIPVSSLPSIDEAEEETEVMDTTETPKTNLNEVDLGEAGQKRNLPVNESLGVRGLGDPNAPVKIQEFFSLTCNHCATFHTGTFQELKRKYIDTGKVYFVYEEFPLNGPALYASKIARCLPEDKYAGYISVLLRDQTVWAFGGDFKSDLKQRAVLAGMSEEDFEACFNNEELQTAIGEQIDAAMDIFRIRSTPTFVFNDGERILRGGQNIESFDGIIALLSGEEESSSVSAEDLNSLKQEIEPVIDQQAVSEMPSVEEVSSELQEIVEDAVEEQREAWDQMQETVPLEETPIEEAVEEILPQ
ncbi:MAG: thioredoxin domain-containing protein [Pseudomonadota bacterium]